MTRGSPMDPQGPTGPERPELDDAVLAVLVREVANDWSLPPQRLDMPSWRDRIERNRRQDEGRTGRLAPRRLLGLAAVAIVATVSLSVIGPTTPQAPTGLYVSSLSGNLVTLRWNPASLGPAASQYVLEGGVNSGQVLASLPTGSASPVFTFTAPTGAFYLRMHQLTGANRSGPTTR